MNYTKQRLRYMLKKLAFPSIKDSIFLLYFLLSIPIVSLFSINEYFRFVYFEIVNQKVATFTPPPLCFGWG